MANAQVSKYSALGSLHAFKYHFLPLWTSTHMKNYIKMATCLHITIYPLVVIFIWQKNEKCFSKFYMHSAQEILICLAYSISFKKQFKLVHEKFDLRTLKQAFKFQLAEFSQIHDGRNSVSNTILIFLIFVGKESVVKVTQGKTKVKSLALPLQNTAE